MKNQPFSHLTLFIKLLFISVSLLLLSAIFMVFLVDYEGFIKFVLQMYSEKDKAEKLKTEYLTVSTFNYFRYILLFLSTLLIVSFFILQHKIPVLSQTIHNAWVQFIALIQKAKKEFTNLTYFQKILLVLLVLAVTAFRIVYLFKYPLTNDEVFSYLFFVERGFLVSASYYPGPNNHLLYTQLCVVVNLFLNDPLLVMRLPSLLAGFFVFVGFFMLVKKKLGFEVAFLSVSFFSCSYTVFYYSIHGRGYTLLSLFVLLSLFSLLNILKSNNGIYSSIFAASCILGIYTIPVFLYPYISLVVVGFFYFLYRKDGFKLKQFLGLNVLVAFFVVGLYSPVFLVSGIESVIANSWVAPLSSDVFWSSIDSYIAHLSNYFWNVEKWGLILTLAITIAGIFVLFRKREYGLSVSILSLILVPFIVLSIQEVQPFFRVWNYLILVFALLLALIFKEIFDFTKGKVIKEIGLGILVLVLFLLHFKQVNYEVQKGFPHYTQLSAFLNHLFTERPKSVYVEEDTYQLFIRFRAHEQKFPLEVYTRDTSHLIFDTVILPSGLAFPSGLNQKEYEPFIFNMDIDSYRKKKD